MNSQTETRDESHAEAQARAQCESIVEMVAALECDYDRLQELRDARDELTRTRWHACLAR